MKDDKTKLIIFDLGNVIFRIDWLPMFKLWEATSGVSAELLQERFKFDENYQKLERGDISGQQFANSINKSLGINISLAEFKAGWNAIFLEVLPGIELVLEQIKNKYTLVAYTNTNEVHYQIMPIKYSAVFKYFDRIFKSFEMRTRKPEPAGFMEILKTYDCKPQETIFFDDLEMNVQCARELGINSVLVDRQGVVERTLLIV